MGAWLLQIRQPSRADRVKSCAWFSCSCFPAHTELKLGPAHYTVWLQLALFAKSTCNMWCRLCVGRHLSDLLVHDFDSCNARSVASKTCRMADHHISVYIIS